MAVAESKGVMFLIFSLLFMFSMVDAKQDQNCKTNYEVKGGDTCYSICQKFNLTKSELQTTNHNMVCEQLYIGQLLCISGKAPPSVNPPAAAPQKPVSPRPKNPNCKTKYTVQSGDTCYAIWTKFNITEKEFRDVNSNIVCEKLVVGQSLCIDGNVPTGPMKPVNPPSPAPQGSPVPGPKKPKCKHFYEVQDGDTCYAIWQKFHLLEEKFKEKNPRVVCELLYIGQKLCIDR